MVYFSETAHLEIRTKFEFQKFKESIEKEKLHLNVCAELVI